MSGRGHRPRRPLHRHRGAAARVGGGDVRAAQGHLRARSRAEPRDAARRCRPARSTSAASRRPCSKVVDPHLLAYNDTWDKVDAMLEECLSPAFRDARPRLVRRRLGLQLVLRRPRRLRRQSPAPGHGLPQRLRPLPRRCSGRRARRRTACTSTTIRTRSAGRPTAAPRTGGPPPTASTRCCPAG